ncbi:MAG: 3'(2'),5'-bisphosphate nucleotidase CysQ [Methyloligellaceae bacterium]
MAADHASLARQLTATAWRAGRLIMSHFGKAGVEAKADRSPVTAADREADALIVQELQEIAPGIPVISEEGENHDIAPGTSPFFLVDPLDGTREFISGSGEFTVNIALIEDDHPRFGLIYAPALARLYVTLGPRDPARLELSPHEPLPAWETLTFEKIATRPPPERGLTAVVSRSHMDERTARYLEEQGITDTIPGGSSLKFCLLAEGKADIYPRFGRTMEWDIAAGHAILAAAGGVVIDETGKPLRYGKVERGLDNPGFVAWARPPR